MAENVLSNSTGKACEQERRSAAIITEQREAIAELQLQVYLQSLLSALSRLALTALLLELRQCQPSCNILCGSTSSNYVLSNLPFAMSIWVCHACQRVSLQFDSCFSLNAVTQNLFLHSIRGLLYNLKQETAKQCI